MAQPLNFGLKTPHRQTEKRAFRRVIVARPMHERMLRAHGASDSQKPFIRPRTTRTGIIRMRMRRIQPPIPSGRAVIGSRHPVRTA
jgi:hypothetical protein